MKQGIIIGAVIIILFIIMSSVNKTETIFNPITELETNKGKIKLELYPAAAPKAVENFIKLAKAGFYDGTLFHRVIKNFMIQGGDPLTKENPKDWSRHGTGGPGYVFADEVNSFKVERGVIAMANSGPDTNGSQFFIVTAEAAPWLDGKHTVFGRVIEGMETVTAIENSPADPTHGDHPLEDIVLIAVKLFKL